MLDQDEVTFIHKSTPFIKQGQLLTADAVRDEAILAKINLDELDFEAKSIGKGSYGTV